MDLNGDLYAFGDFKQKDERRLNMEIMDVALFMFQRLGDSAVASAKSLEDELRSEIEVQKELFYSNIMLN